MELLGVVQVKNNLQGTPPAWMFTDSRSFSSPPSHIPIPEAYQNLNKGIRDTNRLSNLQSFAIHILIAANLQQVLYTHTIFFGD